MTMPFYLSFVISNDLALRVEFEIHKVSNRFLHSYKYILSRSRIKGELKIKLNGLLGDVWMETMTKM